MKFFMSRGIATAVPDRTEAGHVQGPFVPESILRAVYLD